MQEDLVNQFTMTLQREFTPEQIRIIKTKLVVHFINYDLVKKNAEIIPVRSHNRELETYLFARNVAGLSEATLRQYKLALQHMLTFVNKEVKDIKAEDIRYYLYQIKTVGNLSDSTMESKRSYINVFFQWLVNNDYLDKNPCRSIDIIRPSRYRRIPLTNVEMEKLRNACRDERERAIIEFLYSTACRVSEMAKVKIEDINFDERIVKLHGKGKKDRKSYINARCIVALYEYLKRLKYTPIYLFGNSKGDHGQIAIENFERIVKEIGQRAEIEGKVFPHRIRHTAATDAVRRGMKLEEVSKWLGHESVETTMIYVRVGDESVKNSYTKFMC